MMERLDVYDRWLAEEALIKHIDHEFSKSERRWAEDFDRLQKYAYGGNPFENVIAGDGSPAEPPFFLDVAQALTCAGRDYAVATRGMLAHEEGWNQTLKKASAYEFWRIRLRQRARKSTLGMSFNSAMAILTDCLFLGWMEQVESLTREIYSLYEARRYSDVQGRFAQPLYHWILRILFDYYQISFDGWGKGFRGQAKDVFDDGECFGEPVLNELFASWRDSDLHEKQDHIIWLCNYYTHRTCEKDGNEFGNDLLHTRFPAVILAWLRLRECLGLHTPEIHHPLMDSSYACLPERQPFYTDETLERTLARLREEEAQDLGGMLEASGSAQKNEEQGASWLRRFLGRK
ncbi:hypothetical protein [Ralstonia solanacearum]|uniref:hypothetical protein n=1 Tax=Ralstonia solanacearum TaxID=305 RepID=UPI0013C324CD|nr:hypothetical protein [Ralstonia solanacearum]